MVRAACVRPGATVGDAGKTMSRRAAGANGSRLVGDAFDEVAWVAGCINPVPGGIGPATATTLMENPITAAYWVAGVEAPTF
ncbi:MAG: hypothetical protein E5X85_32885 [Mesorhizobium sp.]|nr:MAG: hypothetical protein E5Y09_32515 [Mesorhizobium sp.]TIO64526.1 MAG: hypothetical protein E5X85_32885 [Mesorhizobium sp.]TJV86334.1 MAG: hypothetical protein E5X84_31640 [Mesorhizobium sp.]